MIPARLQRAGLTVGLVVGLAVGLVLATARAAAEDGAARDAIQVAAHQYQLDLPAGWSPASGDAAASDAATTAGTVTGSSAVLSRYAHDAGGARLVITRVAYPNPGAWSRKDAFFDEVEHGIRAAAPGCTRMQRRQHRLGRVPAMDVQFRRRMGNGAEVVHMRFLFFRRYTLTLTLAAPARGYRRLGRAYRALVDSFVPYFAQ